MKTFSRTIGLLFLLLVALPASAETWFVRHDGGTRYSAHVHGGQCDGRADAAYPGSGVNRHCAFNDVRYLWADNKGEPNNWVIAGGDTVLQPALQAVSLLRAFRPPLHLAGLREPTTLHFD